MERRYGETIPLKVLRALFLREAASYPGGANKTQAQAQAQKGGAKESAAEEVKESKEHAE